MPSLDPLWETKNNQEAQGDSNPFRPGRTKIELASQDPSPMFQADANHPGDPADTQPMEEPPAHGMTDGAVLNLMKSAYKQGKEYQQTILQPLWTAAYNSWNNKHLTDSKYNQVRFRGRSRLFRPKTRSAARKKQAEAAAALFSSSDVILIDAPNPSDQKQVASAAVIKELLTYRLSRSNDHAGIPWFMLSMGAHQTAQQTGICASKQYWEYKAKQVPSPMPAYDPNVVGLDGQPMPQPVQQFETKVIRDRPRIRLFPPEDVIRDPAGAWEDQAQDSSYLILRHPMPVVDAREFIANQNPKSVMRFNAVGDAMLIAAAGSGVSDAGAAANIRRARESSGNDRYEDQSVDAEYRTVWLHENFMRLKGEDYVFWSIDDKTIISNVVKVEDAYPEQGGARPVSIGVGALEAFKIDPMSPISAWQPMQQEMNDLVNLRLDTVKQTISPLSIVRRGRSVDIKALQNRSPDSVVYVQDKDDVTFDRPGDASQSSYLEMEKLNADFDEQAGNFSTGSVQSNRALGDTVGGMKIMSGVANAMGEFDLRVWVETWIEPALRQLVKLEQYYESDQTVITLAADKAQLFQKFGQDQVTDELLTNQVTVMCNVGLGSADPMQSVQKFQAATQTMIALIGPSIQQSAKRDAIIDEVFGKAGYKNAAERFFNKDVTQDPRIQQASQTIQQLQQALNAAQSAIHTTAQQAKHDAGEAQKDRASKELIAKINATGQLAASEMKLDAQNAQTVMGYAVDVLTPPDLQGGASGTSDQLAQQAAPTMGQPSPGMAPDQPMNPQSATSMGAASLVDRTPPQMQPAAQPMQQPQRDPLAGLGQMIAALIQSNQQMMQTVMTQGQQQAQATQALAAAISAPKRIIRGPDGLAAGVATMQ